MSSADRGYLPDLGKCLTGDAVVFSWADTFAALSSRDNQQIANHWLNTLTASTKCRSLLSLDVPTFASPSQSSKNQFDTRTAAINVTPGAQHADDVAEIKCLTKWLSKEVNIAEDEALRIVLLEWQRQPVEKLLSGYSDAEIASLKDALSDQNSYAIQGFDEVFSSKSSERFALGTQKRLRLLDFFARERLGLLGVSRILHEVVLLKEGIDTHSSPETPTLHRLGQSVKSDNPNTEILKIVDAVQSCLNELENGRAWSIDAEDINDRWTASELQYVLSLQEILLLQIRTALVSVDSDIVLRWLQIMAGCEFFANVHPGPLLSVASVTALQAMSSLTTLAMLDPATASNSLADTSTIDPSSYCLNGDAAHDIHRILLPAAESCLLQAGPAALAWALVLAEIKRQADTARQTRESGVVQKAIDQVATFDTATGRRVSSGSLQQSIYEDVLSSIMNTSDISDPASYLLRCTIEAGNVFDAINALAREQTYRTPLLGAISLQTLQELLSVAVSSIGYTPEILGAQFAVLSMKSVTDPDIPDPQETFIKNDFLMDNIFAVAAGRFPYEALPFLRLCRLLASAKIFNERGSQYVTFRLRSLDSYTQTATGQFGLYHTVREDENLNLVALDTTANIFQASQSKLLSYAQNNNDNDTGLVPADTLGEVISESMPPVVRWQYTYSGLALLGAWMEFHYLGQLQPLLSSYEAADDVATECVGILTVLLQNTVSELPAGFGDSDRRRLQDEILDEASSLLFNDADIADYVFDTLEQELQAYRRRPSNTFNTSLLIACIDFVAVFSQVRPDQFWASFSKSSLLDAYGADSFLVSIVSGVEVPRQNFSFLQACARLYSSITDAVLQESRSNPVRGTRSTGTPKNQPLSVRIHSTVLLSLTQSLYNAFEAMSSWTFALEDQYCQIVRELATCFERIVVYSNGTTQTRLGPMSSFDAASSYLIQHTHAGPDDLSNTIPVLRHLFRIEEISSSNATGIFISGGETSLTLHALLLLSNTLVGVANLNAKPASTAAQQMLDAVPLLCRNFARTNDEIVIRLIENILGAAAEKGPVSLLGHLGSSSAIDFLQTLKLCLSEWTADNLKTSIWQLLGQLVSRNQQWLAIVVLTGAPPEKTRSGDDGDDSQTTVYHRGSTFMNMALRQLTNINELDALVATSMLRFVIRAQMNWSWANDAMKSNKDFLPAIMSYVCNTYVDVSDDLKISVRNRIAALVTDLTTIHLHHAKARRDATTLKTVVPLLRWLSANGIGAASYKHSLQSNLRKNFASKFNGFEISDFKRTALSNPEYGDGYYYDLNLATKILRLQDETSTNHKQRSDQSFSAELRRANLNLSVVDSEIKMLNSLLNICAEHGGYFAQDVETQQMVVQIIKTSLEANTQQSTPSDKIFENVSQTRADVAISLLQRLVDVKASGVEVRALLSHAWECARTDNGSFEQAIVDNTLTYWRSMLAILLMTLQFHIDRRYVPPAIDASPAALLRHSEQASSTILEIISVVVGQGFRSVATSLQDQKRTGIPASNGGDRTDISHKDMFLVLTIFETILRMSRLPEFIVEASQRLIAEGAIQSCLSLFSWSHLLIGPEPDGEPMYANYCLRFLVSLSSLPPIGEELAVEGVLSRLLSSRVVQKLQAVPDGAAHLDSRPHIQNLYNIWATGLLPICLNLLHSVGTAIAAEVSVFMNQFSGQLSRASVAFYASQSRSIVAFSITSTVADEAATLALISYILDSYRNAGASAAVDPTSIQPLHGYDEYKKALSEDIQDLVNIDSAGIKSRLVMTSEKELALTRGIGDDNGDVLVRKVMTQLKTALTCLKGEENGS